MGALDAANKDQRTEIETGNLGDSRLPLSARMTIMECRASGRECRLTALPRRPRPGLMKSSPPPGAR